MQIPVSCGKCKYGETFDLSVDDLCTICFISKQSSDWCDFPERNDGTTRMEDCPLPNVSQRQIQRAEKMLKRRKQMYGIIRRIYRGKTYRIRKRNLSRARKYNEQEKNQINNI